MMIKSTPVDLMAAAEDFMGCMACME